jgi:hypothetical protein
VKWQFFQQPQSLVEQEVTQRDQFRNEEVDLADALVRESMNRPGFSGDRIN